MTHIVIKAASRNIAITHSFLPSNPRKSPTSIITAPKMYLNSQMNAQIALMVNSGHAWGPVMVVMKLNPSQT